MALGKAIRHHRAAQGLTLEQLSERSGVELGTIAALEARDSSRSSYASKIAAGLGLTVEQLEQAGDKPANFTMVCAQPDLTANQPKSTVLDDLQAIPEGRRHVLIAQIAKEAADARFLATIEKYGDQPPKDQRTGNHHS